MHIGTLCVLDTQPRELSDAHRALLLRLSHQVVALMELRLRDREMAEALKTMHRLATEDDLTGLLNRRAWMALLQSEFERSQRFGWPLALVLLDLDHFKQINDRHGHAMGDLVLRGVGDILRTRLRTIDIPGRYGGEELCILLPGTGMQGALTLAELLRDAIASTPFELDGQSISATASFGVATTESVAVTADALLRSADGAMYRAKQAGRNRAESAI